MKKKHYSIAILGAGISGLATAWFLKNHLGSDKRLIVIEKKSRPGGWIQTLRTEGFLFEQGPRSFRTKGSGEETLALVEALGLQGQMIAPHEQAKNRYIYQAQGLQRMPRHLWEVPFNASTRNFLGALWNDWKNPKRQAADESIYSFFSRRLGKDWTENLIDPFVSGIYAGDCQRLSLKSCFPLFDQWEQKHSSLLRGAYFHRSSNHFQSPFIQKMRGFPMLSFQEGMETLPETLASYLKDHLLLGQSVKSLRFDRHQFEIEFDNGESITADQVVSTLPMFSLGNLFSSNTMLKESLQPLPYASLTVMNIGFSNEVLPLKGFGYLVPSKWKLPVLGCVWDSCAFPEQNSPNQTRLTMMMGGSRHPEVNHFKDSELKEQTLKFLRDHLKISQFPDVMQITKASQAIPQFEVGYSVWKDKVQALIQSEYPGLYLSGSGWTGVSINDCIAQARQLSQQIAEKQ